MIACNSCPAYPVCSNFVKPGDNECMKYMERTEAQLKEIVGGIHTSRSINDNAGTEKAIEENFCIGIDLSMKTDLTSINGCLTLKNEQKTCS